ncbi:hypothetical protein X832_gp022 [Pseudomonas phage PAK_P5]|uniref:Uncharacterized protein n=1 Tax=Pseudomonas phage PAK_P5 TaxID=1327964 RepID=V5JXR1_9CAUD|nr:hypothetical protein X832_gp022 [Pseudomonas phage PAK_P5]AGR89492.1 hypothetical protein PAK_P500022 [Pseudomonas phage PAK_P5]
MDLLLDENSHDIVFVNGQTPVTQGQVQIVAQRLKIKLWTFLGGVVLEPGRRGGPTAKESSPRWPEQGDGGHHLSTPLG